MMRRLLVSILLFMSVIYSGVAQSLPDPFSVGRKAPVLTFNDMAGKVISLESLKGNVIVLNFWNIGCKGCEQERATLNWLSDSLKHQAITFVSITMNKPETMATWLKQHPITYRVIGNIDFMGLTGPSFFRYICLPTTLVIDRRGIVRYNQCGPIMGQKQGRAFGEQLRKWHRL